MFTDEITYKDYDGLERTEKVRFNLTEAELMELEIGTKGGFVDRLKDIVAAQDAPEIMETFKKILSTAYGEKSADGRRFVKKAPDGHKLFDDFRETEMYSKIFMKLASDEGYAQKFMIGILPEQAQQQAANNPAIKELK